jgi:hypothetical protein
VKREVVSEARGNALINLLFGFRVGEADPSGLSNLAPHSNGLFGMGARRADRKQFKLGGVLGWKIDWARRIFIGCTSSPITLRFTRS